MAADQLSMFEAEPVSANSAGKTVSFSLAKTINGPSQKVFDQWLIPVFIGTWMFGADIDGSSILSLENKVRKGGEFNFSLQRGSKQLQLSGVYQELDIPRKLVFSWIESDQPELQSQITVQFEELEGKTRIKLAGRLPQALAEQKDQIKQQWAARCSALAAKMNS